MTSPSDASSVTSSSARARKGKSLGNRLSSLFAAKASHINDYYIELDEPLRHFGPGDSIKGSVLVDVAKPLGVTHVVVSLFGYLEVFKSHSRKSTLRHTPVGSGSGKRWSPEYYGDGFASLFEDEKPIIDTPTRLDPGTHRIPFQLDFPTSLSLPTSIDFERGTVSYVVSATITRLVTIAPTTTCSRKVFYRDSIDVGTLSEPKPRIVTLEPVDKSSKSIKPHRTLSDLDGDGRDSSSRASNQSRPDPSVQPAKAGETANDSQAAASSPASPRSSISRISSPAHNSTALSERQSSRNGSISRAVDSPVPPVTSRIIKIAVKMSKAGCLPGDIVPLEVTINHVKAIRSLNGVIVTLYRQARVDLHPNLPIYSADMKRGKNEDYYYPRSKTGLGGLSLSAAGSSQVWRKDMSQTFAPLYIDPRTMSAVVKASVRVPDEAFPTMQNAPGAMMSFKYIVEVIIDIHGKLGSQINALSARDPTNRQLQAGSIDPVGISDSRDDTVTAMGHHCVDTTQMRREKHAVTVSNDLVIGTKDSVKAQGKRTQGLMERHTSAESESFQPSASANGFSADANMHEQSHAGQYEGYDYDYQGDPYSDYGNGYGWDAGYYDEAGYYHQDPYYYDYNGHPSPWQHHQYAHHTPDPPYTSSSTPAPPVPLPRHEDESHLSEKERLRRAEARLLPSAPPSASPVTFAPSAPYIPEESEPPFQPSGSSPSSPVAPSSSTLTTTPRPRHLPIYTPAIRDLDLAPQPVPQHLPPAGLAPTDDKLERERTRLLGLASSPDDFGPSAPAAAVDDSEDAGPSAPSAHVVDEDTEVGGGASASTTVGGDGSQGDDAERGVPLSRQDTLPRYER